MSESSWPRITIITVVRNAAATLPRAMESLRAQNYPNLEYLVLDAVSTDGTLEVIHQNADLVSHWRSHADDGPNAAYNEGIARATGGIIGLLNADDWYEPGILAAAGEAFRAHPALDVVTAQARFVSLDENGGVREHKRFSGEKLGLSMAARPIPNARFFRKDLFRRLGGFLTHNRAGEKFISSDVEFLCRMALAGLSHEVLERPGYTYRMHAGSTTLSMTPKFREQIQREHAETAEQYLAHPRLTRAGRSCLKRWHRHGTAHLFLIALRARQWQAAWREVRRGFKISGPAWLWTALRFART